MKPACGNLTNCSQHPEVRWPQVLLTQDNTSAAVDSEVSVQGMVPAPVFPVQILESSHVFQWKEMGHEVEAQSSLQTSHCTASRRLGAHGRT